MTLSSSHQDSNVPLQKEVFEDAESIFLKFPEFYDIRLYHRLNKKEHMQFTFLHASMLYA